MEREKLSSLINRSAKFIDNNWFLRRSQNFYVVPAFACIIKNVRCKSENIFADFRRVVRLELPLSMHLVDVMMKIPIFKVNFMPEQKGSAQQHIKNYENAFALENIRKLCCAKIRFLNLLTFEWVIYDCSLTLIKKYLRF